jgi:hypothetical protein
LVRDTPFKLLVQLVEIIKQARILDGDHCLCREVLHQRNLPVGERPCLLAVDDDYADQGIVFEHWHAQRGSCAAEPSCETESGIGGEVGGVVHLLGPQNAFDDAAR